ncbi:MAG: hypothetical protein RR135_01570 [Oscillospiraceae bacterium]
MAVDVANDGDIDTDVEGADDGGSIADEAKDAGDGAADGRASPSGIARAQPDSNAIMISITKKRRIMFISPFGGFLFCGTIVPQNALKCKRTVGHGCVTASTGMGKRIQ